MNTHIIGILAYGSLLQNPGQEIAPCITERIPAMTPFAIEYARSSQGRSGAPTLVPVSQSIGKPVTGQIFILDSRVSLVEAYNILYRREINRIGDRTCIYNDSEQRKKKNGVLVEQVKEFCNTSVVLYASLKPNLPEILREDVSHNEKVKKLAHLAMDSINIETFASQCDGIQYLADNLAFHIITPLSLSYKEYILKQTGASSLPEARLEIARRKGL